MQQSERSRSQAGFSTWNSCELMAPPCLGSSLQYECSQDESMVAAFGSLQL